MTPKMFYGDTPTSPEVIVANTLNFKANFKFSTFFVLRVRGPLTSWYVVWKMFCGDTPTSPEVIVANTLNFKPNFKFS